MLEGTAPWPEAFAERYRAAGWWDGSTVFDVLARAARRRPDHIAIVDGERRLSYAELERLANRLAASLLDLGIAPLDRVVVQCPTWPNSSSPISRSPASVRLR